MNTIAFVVDDSSKKTILKEFDDSISISDILASDDYKYIDTVDHHKKYLSLTSDVEIVYKQYPRTIYPVLKKIQQVIFENNLIGTSIIFALGYNSDLDVVETLEQYINGTPLHSQLETTADLFDIVTFGSTIAKLLESFEYENVVFRDLSPQNILCEGLYLPTLIDYDTACFNAYANSINDKPIGTVGYASPEHFKLGEVTSKSDIYSFGIILNELINKYEYNEFDVPGIIPLLRQLTSEMISNNPDKRPNALSLYFVFSDLESIVKYEDEDYVIDTEEILDQISYY